MGAAEGGAVAAAAVVRLWNGHDAVGGGFLVGPRIVATCAHVVADAIGADPYSEIAPAGAVSLDFPLAPGGCHPPARLTAQVRRWSPIAPDGTGDIALLEVGQPLPAWAGVPQLRRIDQLWDHAFRVLGFPEGAQDGVWSTGLIRGEQGTRWFQLQGRSGEQRVEGGFSGSPVWHEESGSVVGMTVAADRGDTTSAYLVPIDQVLALDPGLAPCPYRGLRPFGEEQAALFFGRDAEIGKLADAVARTAVVAVAGPSGVGKSSLVRAGLVPRLRVAGTPVVELRADLGAAGAPLLADCPAGSVLVIDQFEELAAVDPAAAREVLDQVVPLTASGAVRAVLTVQWAALDRMVLDRDAGSELLGVLEKGTVLVGPMGRGSLREAIVGPAERSPGLAFEPGLVDRILDDAGAEPGRLPLVQSLLADLWELREGGYLTVRGYEAAGGVVGAVAKRAERAVEAAGPGAREDLRGLLIALVRPDHDGRFVRRATPLEPLPPGQRALVGALADARLVVVGRPSPAGPSASGPVVVELAHQALIDHWPRLRGWLDEDSAFVTWQAGVDGRRERWEAEDRADSALLRGTQLAEAADWLPTRAADLTPANADFLRRSRARQRWEVRRWRIVAAVVAVLGLAAGTLSVVTLQRQQVLTGQLTTATAGSLARESLSRVPTDPGLAGRLALAARRADPEHPDARSALAASYIALRSADAELVNVGPAAVTQLAVGGDTVIGVGPPQAVVMTDVAGPSPRHDELPLAERGRLALSTDGRWFAEAPRNGPGVRLRDLSALGEPRTLPVTGGIVTYLRFSADATRLMWVVLDPSGALRPTVWDLRSDTEIPHGLGTLPEGAIDAWLPSDPHLVLLRAPDPTTSDPTTSDPTTSDPTTSDPTTSANGSRLVLRSLVDGSEIAVMPAGSVVVGGGSAVASCAVSAPDAPRPSAVTTVTPVGAVSPSLTVRMLDDSSCDSWLSAGGALIEAHAPGDLEGPPVRITDLVSGVARDTVLPPGVLGGGADEPFTIAAKVAVTREPPDSDPAVVVASGASVFRLATMPRFPEDEHPDALTERSLGAADGRFVLGRVGDALVVDDRRTGRPVNRLPGAVPAGSQLTYGESEIWVVSPEPAAWRLTRYSAPDLRLIVSFLLPVSAEPAPTSLDFMKGQSVTVRSLDTPEGTRILSMTDGVLAVLDPASGTPIHRPVVLGNSPAERQWFQRGSRMVDRPGRLGHAVVVDGDGDLELWDVVRGVRLVTIPTTHRPRDGLLAGSFPPYAMDGSGSRLALLTPDKTIEVWDLDTGTVLGPPLPAPDAGYFLGFDADGRLVELGDQPGLSDVLRFIDLDERREEGVLPLGQGFLGGAIGPDGDNVWFRGFRGSSPYLVPLTAEAWRDGLCAILDRPFSEAETRFLPVDGSVERPCA
ncbi:trypsin-like peptidase domain-containing protein [Actinomycetes bacterium KLBMP 9759]